MTEQTVDSEIPAGVSMDDPQPESTCEGCIARDREIAQLKRQLAKSRPLRYPISGGNQIACVIATLLASMQILLFLWLANYGSDWYSVESRFPQEEIALTIVLMFCFAPAVLLGNWMGILVLTSYSNRFRWCYLLPAIVGLFIVNSAGTNVLLDDNDFGVIAWFTPFAATTILFPTVLYAVTRGRFGVTPELNGTAVSLSDLFMVTLIIAGTMACINIPTEAFGPEDVSDAMIIFGIAVAVPCVLIGVSQLLLARVAEKAAPFTIALPLVFGCLLVAASHMALAAITEGFSDWNTLQDEESIEALVCLIIALWGAFTCSHLFTWPTIRLLGRWLTKEKHQMVEDSASL